ncbi:YraN family protein [Barnesiella sp. An55]|uniref:YraN family protein n=1 Tax=Barnesiella sp. An55 TaxID=1965646 RepID=UPI000B36C06A|nr:YraN family protein [Barnesiella sp. An55]OUN74243.1 endonuclease [Barnesiella sp. An55]HIZ25971.1 YraN family protein [Candidatus Barnesiella merdipullorum]
MARHNQLGKTGEERAAEYLISKGYIIRDINWRSGKMELDLVAYRDSTLVVVEVKTRSSHEFLRPEEAVNLRKIKNIVRATDAYIRLFNIPFEVRFDIVTLVGDNDRFEIEHIEDAFLAPLNG